MQESQQEDLRRKSNEGKGKGTLKKYLALTILYTWVHFCINIPKCMEKNMY